MFSDVHTGSDWRERPGLSALRAAVAEKQIDMVVCFALDRLSCGQDHVALLFALLEDAGFRLVFVTEDFEATVMGKFLRGAKPFAAELEPKKIGERSARGKLLPSKQPLNGYC